MKGIAYLIAALLLVSSAADVEAGLGSFLGKAFKTATAKVQKVLGKGAAKTSGKTGSRVAAKTGSRVAGKVGGSSAKAAGAGAGAVASASNAVISNLGTEGALIAAQLSPESTVKLGEMAVTIARSPHRTQWLETLGVHGSKCVDWLWNHQQKVAFGVGATAVMLKPADFLESIGEVTETSIKVIGEHVVHPIVETTAREFAKPIAHQASLGLMAAGPWWWLSPLLTCLIAMGLFWRKFRRK